MYQINPGVLTFSAHVAAPSLSCFEKQMPHLLCVGVRGEATPSFLLVHLPFWLQRKEPELS